MKANLLIADLTAPDRRLPSTVVVSRGQSDTKEPNMRRGFLLIALVAVLGLAAGPAITQEKAPAPAPKPAGGPAQEALTAWNSIGRKLVAMAEDFPEDKYDFKPKPEVRTFAEQL